MVDNVAITAGTGTTIAADDIGAGVLAQRVKPVWGPDGTGNDIDVATGKPLPVQLRGSDGTDRSNLLPVSVSSIAAGTNAIGKLAANSGVDIGDVDVTSLPALVAGSAIVGKVGIDQTTDGTTNKVRAILHDGTTAAKVLAASTSPAATDPAIVVAISPNGVNQNVTNASDAIASTTNTAAPVVNYGYGYNGTTWDRLQVDASKNLKVTSIVTAAATSVGKAEDVASADADVGVPAMAILKATPADTAGTDGDYQMLQMKNGRVWGSTQAYGDVAHDAADASAPVKVGHKATTSIAGLTLVANADVTDSFAGVDGVQITRPHCNLEDVVTGLVTCTAGANTSGIAALGAGLKFYLLAVLISNTGGTTAGNLSITDGSGGTEKVNVPFTTIGAVENLPLPIPFTANTAVFVDPSGSDTVKVTLVGFKSKV